MSYDLAVFDPRPELRDRGAFIDWYESRTMWADGLDYSEPSNATPALQAWFREAVEAFPPLKGRLRPADFASSEWAADYAIDLERPLPGPVFKEITGKPARSGGVAKNHGGYVYEPLAGAALPHCRLEWHLALSDELVLSYRLRQ